jgi:hypothetical protein
VLDLSDRGRELFERIWPGDLDEPSVERVHEAMRAWVRRQDALDRKRNHFLKAFRNEHGFDRRAYSPEELAAYDGGLASINGEVDSELDSAARELLSFTAS